RLPPRSAACGQALASLLARQAQDMTTDDCSLAAITKADLKRLANIARVDREDFFKRHAEWRVLYRARVLCTALTGAAALHYTNGASGVTEFDVFTFYAQNP